MLDLYDHYAFRFLLRAHPEIFGRPPAGDDSWQERYITGGDEKTPELCFWLAAAHDGDTSSSGALPRRTPPASGTAKPVKKRPAKQPGKAAAAKQSAKKITKAKTAVKKAKKVAKRTKKSVVRNKPKKR